ncbi:MAG: 6-oxopurine nucleoside phosphorylase [Methanophagales archaeon ANME-1-THS]|nr:MAG: 6-oxopurine nucleoside phosphorylase [Methanophagales archaeon ANME-1-THS]
MALGIIGGTSLFSTKLLADAKERALDTSYGTVYLLVATVQSQEVVYIPRHGKESSIPPHRINYKANIRAFKELGVEDIIGVTSVGSLKHAIPPQSLIAPHDYISLCSIPTYYDTELIHVTPGLDEPLRKRIIDAGRSLGISIIDRGVYFQTVGPRLETRAEINLMKEYADVVGMNMASEATLATELGLRYANISTVDNYAHGIIAGEALDYKDIVAAASKSREKVEKVLVKVVEGMK